MGTNKLMLEFAFPLIKPWQIYGNYNGNDAHFQAKVSFSGKNFGIDLAEIVKGKYIK